MTTMITKQKLFTYALAALVFCGQAACAEDPLLDEKKTRTSSPRRWS
ncbi:MAG: hypothetical protein RLZZ450_6649 [Pseudomonadota bacterium]|jgi:hypothetical protein